MKYINFVDYLISKGYSTQRFINKKWIDTLYLNEFSSVSEGGIMVRIYKDNSVFYYGLQYHGLPATLLTPIPQTPKQQSEMIEYISKHNNDEIFNKFYNYSLL
jgi:hypothetical protein